MEFTPSLYSTNQSATPSNPNTEWQLIYPSAGTPTDMDFVGTAVNENMTATIEALDNFNFVVCYEWFVLPDIVGYLGDTSFNNLDFFNGMGENAYVNFYIKCTGGASVVASNPIQTEQMCPDDFTWDLGPLDGYKPGDDLKVTINAPSCDNIANNFYVGFMENTAANSFPFHVDYNLNYGLANNGVSAVTTLGSSTPPPVTCFSGATGFQSVPSNGSTATTTISGSCLTSGTYWLYVVYKKDGVWRTCVSPPIEQTACARDPIIGTLNRCVTHNGVDYNNTDVQGLANLGSTKVCVKLDVASFEAAMTAAGISGTMQQYFAGVNIYAGVNAPTASNVGSSGGSSVSYSFNNGVLEACTNYTPSTADCERFYTFQFIFDYLAAGRDIINVPVEASYSCSYVRTNIAVQLDGEPITDSFCCQQTGQLTFEAPTVGTCEYFLGTGYSNFQSVGSSPSISTDLIECGDSACVRAVCSNPSAPTEPCPCPKTGGTPCPDVTLTIRVLKGDAGNQSAINVQVSAAGLEGTLIVNMGSDANGNSVIFTSTGNGPSIDDSFQCSNDPNITICGFPLDITFIPNNGCNYPNPDGYTITLGNGNNGPSSVFNDQVVIPGSGVVPGSEECDCPEELTCENRMWVEWDCDPETGIITSYSIEEEFESAASPTQPAVETITEENNDDGDLIKVSISRTWYPDDGCPPVTINEILECAPFTPCVNTREVEAEVDDDCLLKLTITDTFDSTTYYDQLELTINRADGEDETLIFDQLNIPYTDDLEICYGDFVRWKFITAFNDGCLQIETIDSITHTPEQESSKEIVLEDNGGLLKAVITPNYVANFNPESETLFIETKKADGTSTVKEYDQLAAPYADDIEIDPDCEYCAWCVVVPDKCCLPTLETEPVCFNGEPDQDDCDYSAYTLGCSYDQENCIFSVDFTGDPLALESSPMFPVFTLGNGLNPLDNNSSGNPIAATGFQIDGEGLLIVAWRLKLPNCEEVVLREYCFGKPEPEEEEENEILGEIKDCITDSNTLLQRLLDCCEETEECECTMAAQCTGFANPDGTFNFAQVAINLSGPTCDQATIQMFDPSGALVTPASGTTYELTVEGDYQIILTDGDCSDILVYKLCIPNPGNLIADPPTFEPVPNI